MKLHIDFGIGQTQLLTFVLLMLVHHTEMLMKILAFENIL